MRVELAYGEGQLAVEVPADADVIRPRHGAAVTDPAAELRRALRAPVSGAPLRQIVPPGRRVAISVCDGTRPQPRELMLRAILDELSGILDPSDVTVLIANGTHRGASPAELAKLLGPDLASSLRVIDHDCRDREQLVWCGVLGAGVPVWLNRAWVEADVKITTGFVEPHFFAGFSGGPKLVAPGLAGLETILTLHDSPRIGDPRATWGSIEGNPVHDDVRAIAAATGVSFSLDVVLDDEQRIVQAFGGELSAMHAAACELVRRTSMRPLAAAYDVVLTSNSGYPLDQNLYQAVKGMSAAAMVVRPGGLIVIAAECRDGFPEHGRFRSTLEAATSAAATLRDISTRARPELDQWQVQVLARVLGRARVAVHSDGLSPAELDAVHLAAAVDVSATVAAECREVEQRTGSAARVCVLPEGPQTIPYLTGVGASVLPAGREPRPR
jgi:nickel-dependent lactate racemase